MSGDGEHTVLQREMVLGLEGQAEEAVRFGAGHDKNRPVSPRITKNGIQLLAAQKPIKRQGWRKGKFALFQRQVT